MQVTTLCFYGMIIIKDLFMNEYLAKIEKKMKKDFIYILCSKTIQFGGKNQNNVLP